MGPLNSKELINTMQNAQFGLMIWLSVNVNFKLKFYN